MIWFKKHADSIAVISVVVLAVLWMTSQITNTRLDLSKEISDSAGKLQKDIANLQKEVAVIKTVLIMNRMMPKELAIQENEL